MLAKSINRITCTLPVRAFSSADYQSLNDHLFHVPTHKPQFGVNNRATVFDNTEVSERRFAPFEIKETTFKNGMGFCGTLALDTMFGYGMISQFVLAGWCLNWSYQVYSLLAASVNKVELHSCGRQVTLHTRFGSSINVPIADIQKKQHEKSLVETYEESFMFPIEVQGKGTFYLHGNGHETIKNGEVFRAILNGQAIKL